MDQVLGSGDPPSDVRTLNDELADVARETAQLLLNPRYDEAELAELDVRARALRRAIRKALVRDNGGSEPVHWNAPGGRLVSGG